MLSCKTGHQEDQSKDPKRHERGLRVGRRGPRLHGLWGPQVRPLSLGPNVGASNASDTGV